MTNPLSYCGLVDAKIRASDKDLPVECASTFPFNISFLDIGFFFHTIVFQYLPYFFAFFISADENDPINIGVKLMLLSRYGTVTHERGRAYGPNKCSGMLIKYL